MLPEIALPQYLYDGQTLTASEGLVYAVGVDRVLRRRLPVGGLRGHVEARHGGRGQRRQGSVERLRAPRAYR